MSKLLCRAWPSRAAIVSVVFCAASVLVGCGSDDDSGGSSGGTGGSAGAGASGGGGSSGAGATGGGNTGGANTGGANTGGASSGGSSGAGGSAGGGGVPAGCLLAFRSANDVLSVVTSTGAQQVDVITEADQIREHRWHPNGKSLAYVVSPNFDLVTIGVDGTGRKVLATGAQQIDWSADGAKLAYTHLGNIYVVNADGTGQKQLTTTVGSQHPRWSPDGTKIAFDRTEIYVVGSDGSNETKLNDGNRSSPAWSPDGTKIAAVDDGDGLYVSNADGSGLVGPFGLRPRRDEIEWSPDGSVIVFTNQPSVISDTGISSIKADGTDEKVLVPAMGSVPRFGPAWSPKGTRISFTRSAPNGASVWTMDPAGQNPAQLVKGSSARWNPTCNE